MICSQCNKEFIKTHHSQKYCSKECSKRAYEDYRKRYNKEYQTKHSKPDIRADCRNCNKEFTKNHHSETNFNTSQVSLLPQFWLLIAPVDSRDMMPIAIQSKDKEAYLVVLTASTCSLEYSLASISFLTLFDTRVYSSSICLY